LEESKLEAQPSLEEHKEDRHVSLPSTELKGAQPSEHTGGVGALPGNVSESSVALLPEEREKINEEPLSTATRQRGDTIKPSVSGGNDEPREPEKELEAKIPREISSSKIEPGVSQPLGISGTDVESQKQKTKNQEATDQGKAVGVADSGAAGAAATGAEETKTDTEGSKLPSQQLGPGKSTSQYDHARGKEEVQTAPANKSEGGYGGNYHPAQLHPAPMGAGATEYQSTTGDTQQAVTDLPPKTTGTKVESVGSEKKPGFITMVKGEMKILAGKMSGDGHKVEEGKKLVHG